MKIFILALVFILICSIGFVIYYRYLIKFRLYKDLVFICKSLKNSISFSKDKIDTILNKISKNISLSSRNIIFGSGESFIKDTDKEIVKIFLKSLGKGDVEYEINNLSYYENIFSESKENAQVELKKNGTTYLKISICLSIAVCIMLI